jgi:hypothetical protein
MARKQIFIMVLSVVMIFIGTIVVIDHTQQRDPATTQSEEVEVIDVTWLRPF